MVQRFNLETMSGVFPGVRTQTFQRLCLRPLGNQPGPIVWAQVLWYDEPRACVLYLPTTNGKSLDTPLAHIDEPLDNFNQRLRKVLQEAGWQLEACGTCHYWQATSATSADGLPLGQCGWRLATTEPIATPPILALQSSLALSCPHWQQNDNIELSSQTAVSAQPTPPMRKIAEISESKLPWLRRLWRKLIQRLKPVLPSRSWEEKLVERSGVGAGTEACFACQGRIANLGALAVESAEGDPQTFSIWRCRTCYTTYLNDWVDRWVRLDSLETEESYYRVAPAEALTILMLIDRITGGEHPGRRQQRNTQRDQILHFLAGRTPLSHQIRQGR